MRRKKKTTIVTFESRERTTIHSGSQSLKTWCERCGAEVLMAAPNEAARLVGTDTRAIFRGVESGQIHYIETGNGALLICNRSVESAIRSS